MGNKVNVLLILLFSISFVNTSGNLNILVLIPTTAYSHYHAFETLFAELANKGHNISIVSVFNANFQMKNLRQINVKNTSSAISGTLPMTLFTGDRRDIYRESLLLSQLAGLQCESFLHNDQLKTFLEEDNKFDVIIAEVFNTNCYYGLFKKYDAPAIGISSTDMLPWMYQWYGSPENPAYIPVIFMDYADRMTFFQRVENTLMLLYSKLVHKFLMANPGNEYSKKYLGIDLFEGGDISYNFSLLLTNRHFTYQTPKPLSPNVIEIGGIHLKNPEKLPSGLDSLVSSSTYGIVFMSMGTTLQGSTFPIEKKKMFLDVFSRLKQTVIWKWEDDMEDLPDNVKIIKWVPQLDLLCHPNVKLFITHGGLLGTQESVYCGVPMLIFPQFADQHSNAAALDKYGISLTFRLKTVTENALHDAIQKLLGDEISETAQMFSERFKDRPISPMDTAIYWIEYVARHKGAPFMRTAVTDMPFYQYLLLDVIGVLLGIMLLSIYISLKFISFFCRLPFLWKSESKLKTE